MLIPSLCFSKKCGLELSKRRSDLGRLCVQLFPEWAATEIGRDNEEIGKSHLERIVKVTLWCVQEEPP